MEEIGSSGCAPVEEQQTTQLRDGVVRLRKRKMFEDPIVDLIYDILCALTPLPSLFWMYLIIFQSPAEMRIFKWLLLKLAITEELFVFSCATLLKPDLLFPAEGAAIRGVAGRWGGQIGAHLAVVLAFASGGGAMLGVSDCAHLRALMIWQRDDLIEQLFNKGLVLIYVFIFHIALTYVLMAVLVWWAVEDPQEFVTRMEATGYYEYIAYYAQRNATFVSMNTQKASAVSLVGYSVGGLMLVYLENMTSVYFMMKKLRELRSVMSRASFQGHIAVIRMIWTQSTYPLLMWMMPIWATMMGMILRSTQIVSSNIFKHYVCLSIMFYPTVSLILSILCFRPYKVFILEKVFRMKVLSPVVTAEHSEKSNSNQLNPVQPSRNLNEEISEYIAP